MEAGHNAPMTFAGSLRPATHDAAGSWISGSLGGFASGVRWVVPPIFEAYARILHPAWASDGTPVRWETVAAWSGGTVHGLAEFEALARRREPTSPPAPFRTPPSDGALPPAIVDDLGELLRRHTATLDWCFFGVWEGYGWLDWMAPDRPRAARLSLPNRTYLLFEGPLGSVVELGWSSGASERTPSVARFHRESPNLIWPADRSWFVASEIDLDSTFVGGSMALVEELIGDGRFDAWPASPDDPVTADSDSINRATGR